jgi:hypothetical protein
MRVSTSIVVVACIWFVAAGAMTGARTLLHAQVAEPSMTDEDYENTMKKIGSTFRSLRFNNEAMNHVDGAREARRLADWFADVQRYWQAKRADDAVGFARQAVGAARKIEEASTVMNMDDLMNAEKTLAAACESCHTTYREKLADGTFRIK